MLVSVNPLNLLSASLRVMSSLLRYNEKFPAELLPQP